MGAKVSKMADTPTQIDLEERAAEQLLAMAAGDPTLAAAMWDVAEEDRHQKQWVKYWEPCGDEVKFWDERIYERKIWVVLGGNRSGKTDLGCFLDTAWLLGKEYFRNEVNWKWVEPLPIPDRATNVRVVGLNSDLLKDPIWEKLVGSTNHPPFIPEDKSISVRKDHEYLIKFTHGSKLQGKSADVDPKTHGGPSCDLVHIDEEAKKAIYNESYQRTTDCAGKILVTATPLDDISTSSEPWLFDLVEQWKDGDPDVGVIFMSSLNNPHVPEEEKRKLRVKWAGHVEERARLYGEFVRRSGLFYKKWKAEPPLWIPAYDLPKGGYRVVAVDPASTGPVAAVWMYFDKRGKMTIYRVYKQAGLDTSEHISNIIADNRGDLIDLWLLDPWRGKQSQEGSNEKIIDVWRRLGLPRLRLAEVSMDVCLEESKEYIGAAFDPTSPHPALEVFDVCEEFKDEIERYVIDSVSQGARKGQSHDRPRKGNDDILNAWQFAAGMRIRARSNDGHKLVPAANRSYAPQGVTTPNSRF